MPPLVCNADESISASAGGTRLSVAMHLLHLSWFDQTLPCLLMQNNMEYGCLNPLRDIVAPANMGESSLIAEETFGNKSTPYHNVSKITTTLFFAGGCSAVHN
jgi:hypothetical protein